MSIIRNLTIKKARDLFSSRIILKRILRDEMHSISVVFDALLTIFGEIPQHLLRLHADGDVILVCPDLQSNEHHTRVQLLFEDLPLKYREKRILNRGAGKLQGKWELPQAGTKELTPSVIIHENHILLSESIWTYLQTKLLSRKWQENVLTKKWVPWRRRMREKPCGCPTTQLGLVNSCCRTEGWLQRQEGITTGHPDGFIQPTCARANICRSAHLKQLKE